MSNEQWRAIRDETGYEVSTAGRVRSVDRVQVRSNGTRQTLTGTVLKQRELPNGYRSVVLTGRRHRYVHHLVLETFVGPRPAGMEACHGSAGQADDSLRNLRWDTHSTNIRDAVRAGNSVQAARARCRRLHLLMWPNLHKSLWIQRRHRSCLACHRAMASNPRCDDAVLQRESDRRYPAIIGDLDPAWTAFAGCAGEPMPEPAR